MTLISGRNKHKLSNESIEGKDPYTWSKISIICFESQFAFYPGVFIMDTQDKQSNNIFTQRILPMSFFNGHTGQTDKQHTYIKPFYSCLFEMDTQDKRSNNTLIQRLQRLGQVLDF